MICVRVLAGAVLTLLQPVVAFNPLPITSETMAGSYNFLIHGDWGWNSYNQSLTAYEMGVYGWVVDAQFVIALGDNFYNDGTESTEDELWETAFHDVYTAPSLNVPWYGVLGNHDYHGKIESQVDRSSVSGETMWSMPSTYYVKNYEVAGGGVMTIIYIDTQLIDPYQADTSNILEDKNWEDDKTTHIRWIIDQLEEYSATSQWLFVAGHYPIISIGEHGDDQYLINDLLPTLLKYNVHAYLCGHDHIHSHVVKDGLHHIISGNSAGRGPFGDDAIAYLETSAAVGYIQKYYTDCGFIIASATATSVNFTFMNNLGNIEYVAQLSSPHNSDLIEGGQEEEKVSSHLKQIGLPPKVVGTIIFVPTLTIMVVVIVFLGKDFINKLLGNQEAVERRPATRIQDQELPVQRTAGSSKGEDMDYSMDSSSWSDINASTDRLAPSRYGK